MARRRIDGALFAGIVESLERRVLLSTYTGMDFAPLDQQGLNLILTGLANLKIGTNGALTGTVA